jgi:sialic acid synthase SpsE
MTKLIAEIGWNHMGDMKLAKEMISTANESGADFAKFQTWSVDRLKSGVWDTDGRRKIYENAELDLDKHIELKEYCDKVGIGFMSSVFSIEDAKLLKQVVTDYVKIPSFESRNDELINYCSDCFEHIILSTGTSKASEITTSIGGIANITLLHCVSSYPCNLDIVNLPRIDKLRELSPSVGFSDHTKGVDVSILSLGYDLDFIEKHFTIDNDLPGRDNKFAILPDELKQLKNSIDIFARVNKNLGGDYQECELDSRENYTGRFNG